MINIIFVVEFTYYNKDIQLYFLNKLNQKNIAMEFKLKLKYKREQKGMTQEEFGKELGVTKGAVSQWESGKTFPTWYKVKEIERILDDSFEKDEIINNAKGAPVDSYYDLVSENIHFKMMIRSLKIILDEISLTENQKKTILKILEQS